MAAAEQFEREDTRKKPPRMRVALLAQNESSWTERDTSVGFRQANTDQPLPSAEQVGLGPSGCHGGFRQLRLHDSTLEEIPHDPGSSVDNWLAMADTEDLRLRYIAELADGFPILFVVERNLRPSER